MKKIYLTLAVIGLMASTVNAQLTVTATATNPTICLGSSTSISATATPVDYTMTSIALNMQPLWGVNYLAENGVAVTPLSAGNLDDGRWENISLPFNFTFYGNIYNSIHVSTNGWIGMGSTNTLSTGFGFPLPSASLPNAVIHAITSDIDFRSPTTSSLEYFEDGSYPNRIFVVSYNNLKFLSAAGTANVQVIFYETSNIIEIHTQDCTNTTKLKAQGIENGSGSSAKVVPGKNNTANWATLPSVVPCAYQFTPDNITFSWSPATGLNTTTGPTVIATPTVTTTYTVTATNTVTLATGNNTATITIDPASFVLAATPGGAQICHNISISPGGTYYRDISNCNLIANITPSGGSPVSNSINTCISLATGSSKRGTTNLYGARQYDIEPLINPATSTASIKLYYLQSEFNDFNTRAADSGHRLLPTGPADATGISNLMIRQFHGTGTNPLNYTGASQDFTTAFGGFTVVWNATNSLWEVTVPVTGFSGFYLTSKKTGSLALNLDYFKGVQIDKKHLLNWKVICTSAEAKFEIMRSGDGVNYSVIGQLTASQLRCNEPFDFTDEFPLKGANYYRIKMIDVDGKTTLTNIVLLTLKTARFELVSLNPNLVRTENPKLRCNATEKNELKIIVSDFTGRIMQQQVVAVQPGLNEIVINSSTLSAGAYLVTAIMAGEKPQTLRLVKQ
ncbi:MAG: T9SS type A sorting domain-containing protein [Chitinophagaceae bacterium]|nr:T9SS type A sorting domain-containing protein [Chitinophagaceae bacterium]